MLFLPHTLLTAPEKQQLQFPVRWTTTGPGHEPHHLPATKRARTHRRRAEPRPKPPPSSGRRQHRTSFQHRYRLPEPLRTDINDQHDHRLGRSESWQRRDRGFVRGLCCAVVWRRALDGGRHFDRSRHRQLRRWR